MSSPACASPGETLTNTPARNVLVIDDSALIREAAKLALGAIGGWRIVTAACGEEGIERAGSERFDAVLLDMVMPGMDGIAVAERLHGMSATAGSLPSLPIVLLTAHERLQDSERFRGAPVVGVIAKPFDVSDLSLRVAELLGWPA